MPNEPTVGRIHFGAGVERQPAVKRSDQPPVDILSVTLRERIRALELLEQENRDLRATRDLLQASNTAYALENQRLRAIIAGCVLCSEHEAELAKP